MFKNILLSVSLFCACTVGLAQEKAAYTPEMQAFHNISSNEIYKFVEELCKPEYQGRQAGSPSLGCQPICRMGTKTGRRPG